MIYLISQALDFVGAVSLSCCPDMEVTFPAIFGAEVAAPIALLVCLEQDRSTNLEASCPVTLSLLHLYGLFSVAILAAAAKQRHLISSSCLALCLVSAGDC